MAGNIQKLDAKRWYVRVSLGYDEETGKRLYHTKVIHGTKHDADRYLAGVLRERDMGRFAEPEKISVNTFLDKWLEAAAKTRLRGRSYQDYVEVLRRYIRPQLGGLRLGKLTPIIAQTLYARLVAEGLSPQTVRKAHAVFRTALTDAVKWGMLPYNPVLSVNLPRRTKPQLETLDQERGRRFIAAAMGDPRGLVLVVGLASGLRPQEYLALRWPDLDLKSGAATVNQVLVRPRSAGGGWYLEEPKTKGSRRTVLLPASLLDQLREHRRRQIEERLAAGPAWQDHGLVFCGSCGEPLDAGNLNRRHFKPILEAAGLPPRLRPYDLRHACATVLLERGEHLKVVAEQLGHSTITLTADTYSHVTPGMLAGAARKLDEALFSSE